MEEKSKAKEVKDLEDLKKEDAESSIGGKKKNEQMYFDDARTGKEAPARLYRKVAPTQELAENNYYKLPIEAQLAHLVPVSGFWVDYAKHDGKSPFLSRHLADASHNFTEMMFALALLDLPFTPAKHDLKFADGKMTLTPGSSVLAFLEEVKPVAGLGDKVQILASQNFYRHGDRYKEENGERLDKFVTEEFVIHTVYGLPITTLIFRNFYMEIPDEMLEAAAIVKARIDSAEQWMFADEFTERLRFEVSPEWAGEMPYTMLITPAGQVSTLAGVADMATLERWLSSHRAGR